jgi:hypothetical protein
VKRFLPGAVVAGASFLALAPVSCSSEEPRQRTYFERTIAPILSTSCVRTNTGAGCHVQDIRGNALGNLDVSTYAGVAKRRDLLVDYGPYGQPAFLIKNVDPFQVEVQTYEGKKVLVNTDIKHAGGSILDPTGSAYQTLRRWIQNGATENNTGLPPQTTERLPCNPFVPQRAGFDLTKDPPGQDFGFFKDKVDAVLTGKSGGAGPKATCAAGNCHGNFSNTLYLTCGDSPEQLRWNYLASQEYLAQTPEQSELTRRPLSPAAGGAFHDGGVIFDSAEEPGYKAILEWAKQHGPPKIDDADPGFAFFSQKVQPMLVKKGCMMIQCHSGTMFHDYRLRGGASGSFSLSATRKNYELSLAQLSIESEDPNASRMIRKNLYRPEVCSVGGCDRPSGITHRGGPLLEDFGDQTANAKICADAKYDYDNGDVDKIPAYCVFAEWLRREREIYKVAPLSAVVYVKRPVSTLHKAQEFETYAPGADLRRAAVSVAGGTITAGNDTSLTAGCGLNVATADIKRPQVSWDGAKIAFAARSSASEPLAIYEMNADGSQCAKHEVSAHPPSEGGLLVHDFDPLYAPPENGFSRLVFASTRGNAPSPSYDYSGPQRSPADPSKLNSNLYSWELDPSGGGKKRVRQLTYLLNMERMPSFMSDGRIIFSAEKRAPNFAQIALRRVNIDGGDYHPLYAQRGSIGFPSATGVIELADKNFAAIFGDGQSSDGSGTLGIFNRSIGIDFTSKRPEDYPIDPGVIDPNQLQSPAVEFFLHSLRVPDPGGRYLSPSPLPNGLALVSYGEGNDYDLWVMNDVTGQRTRLLGAPDGAEVDAVGVYGRFVRPIFRSTFDEPNGHVFLVEGQQDAEITVHDMPVLASLLFQNTPTGRIVDPEIRSITLYEDLPPPREVDSYERGGSNVVSDAFGRVYVRRRSLGTVPLESDGSTKFKVPGGVPFVIKLPDTKLSREKNLPRIQREQMVFVPGEYAHQSFKAEFFDGLCGACHGSISGKPVDAALKVDFVTKASATEARGKAPYTLSRGEIEGPPQGN